MIKVVTSKEIKKLDLEASLRFKIPSIVLMENAAIGVVDFITNVISNKKNLEEILILCGHGNNGGDGFSIARHLVNRGFKVKVVYTSSKDKLSTDAKINFEILQKFSSKEINLELIPLKKFIRLKKTNYFSKVDLIIDALLGTGLNSPLREPILSLVSWANDQECTKLAVDIPTGLSSDNGKDLGKAFHANYTLTMGLPKIGLFINDGPRVSGEILIVDISYPSTLSNYKSIKRNLVEIFDIKERLPQRPYDAHKYSVGKIFAIAGSRGLTGAAKMSCEAALRTGCGGVLLLTTKKLQDIYAKSLKEVMTYQLKNNEEDYFVLEDLNEIEAKINWADVLMIGPGLGQHESTGKFIMELLKKYPNKRKVIDADGLNLLSDFIENEKLNLTNSILTPHLGEFSRLIKRNIDEIKENIFKFGSNFAKRYNTVLVLKGAPTLIFDKNGEVFINSTGNPGMATVGMGDVLTGITSGFYAQGLSDMDSAIVGVFIHGLSGDIAEKKIGMFSLISSDVIKFIPKAIKLVKYSGEELF